MNVEFVKSTELGRVPLRYDRAVAILRSIVPLRPGNPFPINPLWFGKGIEPRQLTWPILLPDPASIGIDPATYYSDFVNESEQLLADLVLPSPHVRLPASWLECYMRYWGQLRVGADEAEKGIDRVKFVVSESAAALQGCSEVAASVAERLRRMESNLDEWREKAKHELTNTSYSVKVAPDMKIAPRWPALKRRLQKATEEIGMKPALAKALNVDPTQISQWLSESKSAREPGGDYALRMLKWVELQEANNNASPVIEAPTRQ